MFCPIMFIILESLLTCTSEWCSEKVSVITTTCVMVIFILLVYMVLLNGRTLVSSIYYRFRYQRDKFMELYEAVEKDDVPQAIAILSGNRDLDLSNTFKYPEGYTPFMVACANANTQLVKFMLEMGANVALKSKQNETAFYLAAFYHIRNRNCKNATCIRTLFYAGANIDEPGRNNYTPLQMAAVFGNVPLIKWLLLKNAKINTTPHPYVLARSQGHQEAANLLSASMDFRSIKFK